MAFGRKLKAQSLLSMVVIRISKSKEKIFSVDSILCVNLKVCGGVNPLRAEGQQIPFDATSFQERGKK